VDGFNVFHRLLEGRSNVKWLDLFALAKHALREENSIVLVRYFTARVTDIPADPEKSTRQDVYLRALEASGVHIHYGKFRERQKRARLVEPCSDTLNSYVSIWSREEKGSDVNLAVHMTNDAWKGEFDCAVVVSNDSDLAEALRLVRDMGKTVGILSPVTAPAIDLRRHADFVRPIRPVHLARSQFPLVIELHDGHKITCPPDWFVER
jgi:uncharacterized LabA/DUF88 family protein